MILPKEMGNVISPVFSNEKNVSLSEMLRKNIVMRLDFASKAIFNVKNDVNQVSDKLKNCHELFPAFQYLLSFSDKAASSQIRHVTNCIIKIGKIKQM